MIKKDLGTELQHTKIKPNQNKQTVYRKQKENQPKEEEFKNIALLC